MTRVVEASAWHAALVGQTLNRMREGGVLCDIIVQSCEGREFLAHGCILAAASPILKSAINNIVGQLSILRLDWLSGSVLETLLDFIYTGEMKMDVGDSTVTGDILYAVGQLEMSGMLVGGPDVQTKDTGSSDMPPPVETGVNSGVIEQTSRTTPVLTEPTAKNTPKVCFSASTISSPPVETGVSCSVKAEVFSGDTSGSKLDSAKSGADHSYADAESASQTGANLNGTCSSKSTVPNKTCRMWRCRMWGCPTPASMCRKTFLPRAYSLRCSVCGRAFADSMSMANHRLHEAPMRVTRVLENNLEQLDDVAELDNGNDTMPIQPGTSRDLEVKLQGKDRYLCPDCGLSFPKKSQLNAHAKTSHASPLTCDVCSRACKSLSKLCRHQLTHSRLKPFECTMCDKRFQLNESLVIHARLHTGERPFTCRICQQGFRDKSVLHNHELRHIEDKPFQCAQCGRQYGSRNALSRHRNVHTLERCYRCEHCGRVFNQLSGLMCHRRTHTGEKPYMCSICARPFGDRSSMRRHERVHTGERPYPCLTCGKRFTQSSSLKSHQKTHNKRERDCAEVIVVEIQHPVMQQLP